MNADGSNIQQVTNFAKASFAPFFHPDNKRIIFSSNVQSENRGTSIYISLMWVGQAWRELPKTIPLMVSPCSLVMGKM